MENQLVSLTNLTKTYGLFKAIDDISLTLPAGKIIGLLGPNGSGKTTLIKLLTNLLMRYSGQILINGHKPGIETKKLVSYLPDRNFISDKWTAIHAINYFADFFDDFDKEKAFRLIGDLSIDKSKSFKTLSKGTKEKVQLALVLSRNAKLYLFDEPIAGVDPAARDYIFNMILQNYNKDASVIISTHLISEAEDILDYAVFLRNGKIALAGDVGKIKEETGKSINDLFREIFRYSPNGNQGQGYSYNPSMGKNPYKLNNDNMGNRANEGNLPNQYNNDNMSTQTNEVNSSTQSDPTQSDLTQSPRFV